MCTMTLNKELNGIELSFEAKPNNIVLSQLKNNGFRWHNLKKVWYAKQNEQTLELGQELAKETDEAVIISQKIETKQNKQNIILPLFDRVQFGESENYNLNKSLTTKEITKLVREHIKSRFPECKFSITCSGHSSVDVEILSSPYDYKKLEYSADRHPSEYRQFEEENNKEINAIIDYCEKYIKSYQYCTCYDPYGDYGSSYNIYASVSIYNYQQTEQTEVIKENVKAFRNSLIEQEKAEEIKKEIEFQEHLKQQAIDEANAKIRQEQEKKDIEIINNNVSYSDLAEENQYILVNCQFAHANKNNTLKEYKEEVAKGENKTGFYHNDLKVTREVYFKTAEALNLFSNMLLSDFDFINGTGGSYTDDPRINNIVDYNQMNEEERKSVKWNLEGIAVYYDNELQFVIDSQGYNYARYVGLIETAEKKPISKYIEEDIFINPDDKVNAIYLEDKSAEIIYVNNIKEDWQNNDVYKTAIKNLLKEENIILSKAIIQQIKIEELKVYLYNLLKELNSVQNQFEEAQIKTGDKITIFSISDFGMVSESRIKIDTITNCKYAQYNNAVKISGIPEGKRKQYYTHLHENKCFVVVEGFQTIPKSILWEDISSGNGYTMTKTKYLSCDKQQIKDIKEYFKRQDIKILVDRSNRQ